MSELDWVCKNHYDALCKQVGHEIAVKTIGNLLHSPCVHCEEIAVHLIDHITLEVS